MSSKVKIDWKDHKKLRWVLSKLSTANLWWVIIKTNNFFHLLLSNNSKLAACRVPWHHLNQKEIKKINLETLLWIVAVRRKQLVFIVACKYLICSTRIKLFILQFRVCVALSAFFVAKTRLWCHKTESLHNEILSEHSFYAMILIKHSLNEF